MYFAQIAGILKKIDATRVDVLQKYLISLLDISEVAARQAVYASFRNRTCYESEDQQYALRIKGIEVDQLTQNRNLALLFILRYMPESNVFTTAEPPWTLVFTMSGVLVQIAVIEPDTEVANSLYICSQPIPFEEREHIRRVAIVKRPASAGLLKLAGFTHIVLANPDWEMELIKKVPFEQAWEDVPCR